MKGYALYSISKSIEIHLKTRLPKNFKSRYNVRTGDRMPILVDKQEALLSKWGLIPFDTKKVDEKASAILKPYETVVSLSNRCVVPLNAFYTWKDDGEPFICHPQDGKLMAALGTWDSWEFSPGKIMHSFAFCALSSAAQFEGIAEFVPVIVPWQESDLWLNDEHDSISQDYIFKSSFSISPASAEIKLSKEDNPQIMNKNSGHMPGENLSLF